MTNKNEDCKTCTLKECPPECFNTHEGSMIALSKLCRKIEKEDNIKIHIINEDGVHVKNNNS